MKIARRDESVLTVVDFPIVTGVASLLLVISPVIVFIRDLVSGVRSTRLELGMVALALTGLLTGALFVKRGVFEFDRRRRILTWRRGGVFGAKGGCVPFEKIRSATVETIANDTSAVRSYRTEVATNDGTIPITQYYSQGKRKRCERMREEINRFVHPEACPGGAENDVREMARNDHSVGAVALAKEKLGLSTSEAVRFVDEARDGGGKAS